MSGRFRVSEDDRAFVERFTSGGVEPGGFDHRAHLRLAYVQLVGADLDCDAACESIREALLAFLERHRIDPAKYHETLTRAWILAVRHFLEKTPTAASADAFIDAHPEMLDARIMLTHFDAKTLFSAAAREAFVEPDRDPIPRYD